MARNDNDENDIQGGIASSTLWWGAGGVIVLVIAGLLWILLSGGGSKSTVTPTQTVTASPNSNAPGATAMPPPSTTSSGNTTRDAGGCNVPGTSALVPTSAIPATWQTVGTVAAPSSATAGPLRVNGGVRTCYQHSPTGAVLAAINISVALNSSSQREVIDQQYTPGPGRGEAAALPADSGNGSIAGFLAQACTPSSCLVKVAVSVQDIYVEQTMPMVWSGGDWKVNGETTGIAQPVQVGSLSPYVAMTANGGS